MVSAVNSAGEGAMSIEASATPTTGSSGNPSSPSTPGYLVEFTIGEVAIAFVVLIARKHTRSIDQRAIKRRDHRGTAAILRFARTTIEGIPGPIREVTLKDVSCSCSLAN